MDPMRWKKETADFVIKWIDETLKNYEGPDRKGVPRGEKVGLSKKKKRAAYLMVLHPNAASLREISRIAGTSEGVLKVWRTQDEFQKAMAEGEEALASFIYRRFDEHAKNIYEGMDENKEEAIYAELRSLSLVLQFLSIDTFLHVFRSLAISDDRENDEDPKRRDFRVFAHGILLNSIEEARHYIKGGTPSEWVKKPKNVEINKTLINHMIDLIRNPRMWETEERRRQIGEEAERLKSFVGDLLDTLAGIEKD